MGGLLQKREEAEARELADVLSLAVSGRNSSVAAHALGIVLGALEVQAERWDRDYVIQVLLDATEREVEKRRKELLHSTPCPSPDVEGWTMRQCFAVGRCACSLGVRFGYTPGTMSID